MAPEILEDQPYNTKVDIFSFGLAMLECVERIPHPAAVEEVCLGGIEFKKSTPLSLELKRLINLATMQDPESRLPASELMKVRFCRYNILIFV